MALLKVGGNISQVNADHQYIKFWESYDFKGQERHRLWTAWFTNLPVNVQEGDFVEIEGLLGTKVGKYQKPGEDEKQVVEHNLNDCALRSHSQKLSVAAASPIEEFGTPIDPASAPF